MALTQSKRITVSDHNMMSIQETEELPMEAMEQVLDQYKTEIVHLTESSDLKFSKNEKLDTVDEESLSSDSELETIDPLSITMSFNNDSGKSQSMESVESVDSIKSLQRENDELNALVDVLERKLMIFVEEKSDRDLKQKEQILNLQKTNQLHQNEIAFLRQKLMNDDGQNTNQFNHGLGSKSKSMEEIMESKGKKLWNRDHKSSPKIIKTLAENLTEDIKDKEDQITYLNEVKNELLERIKKLEAVNERLRSSIPNHDGTAHHETVSRMPFLEKIKIFGRSPQFKSVAMDLNEIIREQQIQIEELNRVKQILNDRLSVVEKENEILTTKLNLEQRFRVNSKVYPSQLL